MSKQIVYDIYKNGNFPSVYTDTHVYKVKVVYNEDNDEYRVVSYNGTINGVKKKNVSVVNEAKNVGKSNEVSRFENAVNVAKRRFLKKIQSGYRYKEGIKIIDNSDNSIVDKIDSVLSGHRRFFPMLAPQKFGIDEIEKHISFPAYYQRKLDGERATTQHTGDDVIVMTRRFKKIEGLSENVIDELRNLYKLLDYPDIVFDGELYKHGVKFSDIAGPLRRSTNKDEVMHMIENLDYYIFDMYDFDQPNISLRMRTRLLRDWMKKYSEIYKLTIMHEHNKPFHVPSNSVGVSRLGLVKTYKIKDISAVEKALNRITKKEGFEGIMVKNADAVYKPSTDGTKGRSNDVQKLKPIEYDYFEVVGYELSKRGGPYFTFQLITDEGRKFKATPKGPIHYRQSLVDDTSLLDNMIGKKIYVKFSGWTHKKTPITAFVIYCEESESYILTD